MIHPTAEVQTKSIGKETVIWQFVVILKNAILGKNCNINSHVFIENEVHIGNNVTIKSGVQIWDGVSLEDNVFVGPNVTFTNDLIPRSKQYPASIEKTIVKKGASIGANATIIAGSVIGEYALIGAGSVVTKSINNNEVWVGNPAKKVGFITNNGELLSLNLISKSTGKQYALINSELSEND